MELKVYLMRINLILKKIIISVSIVLVISQFFSPDKNNGDIATVAAFIAETNPPKDVKNILETTCFDCHSAKTKYINDVGKSNIKKN